MKKFLTDLALHGSAVLAVFALSACGGATGPADTEVALSASASKQSGAPDATALAVRNGDNDAIPEWLPAVAEGQSFSAGDGKTVRFGAGEHWIEKLLSGEVQCTNDFFGRDPIYGVFKACEVRAPVAAPSPVPPSPTPPPPTPSPSPVAWQQVAVEWQQFAVPSPKLVRYGVGDGWVEKTVSGDVQCTNAYFGRDPNFGVFKACQIQVTAVSAPVPPVAPPVPPALPFPTPAPAPAPNPTSVTIAPLGTPRILVSDAPTMDRLRAALASAAPSAVRFKTIVDAQMADPTNSKYWGFQIWYAALIGQVTGEATYCRWAVDRTDAFVQSEEALINANQRATVAADSYLGVGPVVGSLSMVYDWCRPQMSAAQRTRWSTYANQAVWNVWNFNSAKWGNAAHPWTGWSVDNPSNNYYYSFLRATMLLGLASVGENPQAQAWLDKFLNEKMLGQLIPTFNRDLEGGGSREGTGYGVALKNLFDLYYLWEKSTGHRLADHTPHTLASIDKMLHDIVPTLTHVAPTGDHARESTGALFDYHREYLQILAHLYPTDAMSGVAKTLLAKSSVPRMANAFEAWADFIYDTSTITAQPLSRLPTAHWGSGTGQFSMRSAWALDATYANLICGPYTESHAHHDQGSFVLFKGGWLATDENIHSHSGLVQEESAHNLVRIEQNGVVVPQTYNSSCKMQALADTPLYSYGLAVSTPSYAGKAAVQKLEREFLFIKPGVVVVLDRVQTSGPGVKRVWTLNLPATPTVVGDRLSISSGANQLDVQRLAPAGLTTQVKSWPQLNADMLRGARVDVADSQGDASVFLHVLGTDQAFSSAVRSDAAGQIGAEIKLADGSTVIARFSLSGTGGSVEMKNSSGVVTSAGALPTGVQSIARFAN